MDTYNQIDNEDSGAISETKSTLNHTSGTINKQKKILSKKRIIITGLVIIVLAALCYGYIYTRTAAYKQQQIERQNMAVIKKVGQLIMLPAGNPVMFRVTDPETAAAKQPFYTGSEVGDVVLIYSEAHKAIVYSEKRNIIVNVGPVEFGTK